MNCEHCSKRIYTEPSEHLFCSESCIKEYVLNQFMNQNQTSKEIYKATFNAKQKFFEKETISEFSFYYLTKESMKKYWEERKNPITLFDGIVINSWFNWKFFTIEICISKEKEIKIE